MQNLFQEYKIKEVKSTITNERADLVRQFLEALNRERLGSPYKPLTARGVAVKVGHIPTQDLYYFLKKCQEARSFGECFFYQLKVKK